MVTGPFSPVPPQRGTPHRLGYIWTVYPRSSDLPMVALGHSSDEDKARAQVEAVLGNEEDHTSWGVVLSPYGTHDVCRRNGSGGFAWFSMWPGPE